MGKQTQSKEKKNIWQTQQMVANPQILKKKKKKGKAKTQYTRPPIHQVKQKLKLETKKPNLKRRERKKKKLISHQRPIDGTFASNLSNRAHQSSPVGFEIGHRS